MNEKTETKSQEEVTGLQITGEPEKITDYYANRWYKKGFRFAINYIHVSMVKSAEEGDTRVDPAAFKEYLDDLLDLGVEDDYFERNPFEVGSYPSGQCPGDSPGTCIQCADTGIRPIGS